MYVIPDPLLRSSECPFLDIAVGKTDQLGRDVRRT